MKPSDNYLPVREAWLRRHHEDALEPALPIVDAHHHFYDRPGWRYLCVLVVNPSVSAKTVQEFIARARANPDKLDYGSGGKGPTPISAASSSRARPESTWCTSRTRGLAKCCRT